MATKKKAKKVGSKKAMAALNDETLQRLLREMQAGAAAFGNAGADDKRERCESYAGKLQAELARREG